ncbi:MAG TPA: MFS transporter, partial [Candidatus Limnocylindrales bacterium]|nr:MFS transporter [Candidatus Limnocylindrales bacterium]
ERPVLARIAVAQGFYGGGLIAASPLYALVYVDRLNLSLADVGVIGILAAIANTVAFPVWGIVSDRLGALAALWMGSAIGVASVIAYAFAPNVLVLWIAALAAGTASGAIDVGIAAAVSDHTSMATRAAAMAGWNALTGARGIVAAFLMSLLLQVGLIDVRFGLLACAASSTIGVVMFVRASRAVSSGAAANRVRPDSSAPPIRPIATPGTPAVAATAATGTSVAPDAPVAVG